MGIRRSTILLLILIICTLAYSQDIVIIGQVIDNDSTPLRQADVWFPGTKIGTTTNDEGFFLLRSHSPQRYLNISVVGFKQKHLKLDYGHDQMIHIMMEEEVSFLEEITVSPDNGKVIGIINHIYRNRHVNETQTRDTTESELQINLTDLPNSLMQKRLFRNIEKGIIDRNDSAFSLPAYHMVNNDGKLTEKSLPVFTLQQWHQIAESYSPKVNLYDPYITILNSNFVSPVTKSPKLYYNYYLVDSTESPKRYVIRFKPKSTNGLYLQGTITADSLTGRIEEASVETSPYTNINILNSFKWTDSDSIGSQALSLGINPMKIDNFNLMGLLFFANRKYGTLHKDNNIQLQSTDEKIDSIANTPFVRFVKTTFDLLLTQYIHAGPIDIGPIFNMLHFNQHDGITPAISLRSNAMMLDRFTIGGYFGYAHKAEEMLYGGNMQYMTPDRRGIIGLFYDHKSYKYGFDETFVFDENNINDADNLCNALFQKKHRATNEIRSIATVRFTFNDKVGKTNITFKSELYGQRIHHVGIDNLGLRCDIRLGWEQKHLDTYFNRHWLKGKYPVVHIFGEAGYYDDNGTRSHYGKTGIYIAQKVPVGFGHLSWTAQASALIGTAPFSMFIYPRSARGTLYMNSDFTLMNQMEFAADMMTAATLRYQTHGYLFGYIPWVKKLGIREDIYFNICHGSLSDKQVELYNRLNAGQSPVGINGFAKMPYIECGFGLSNILSYFRIQFMFRATYRNNPGAQLFGVKWSAEI